MFPGGGTPLACPVWRLPNGMPEDASGETLLFLKHYVKEQRMRAPGEPIGPPSEDFNREREMR
jgi:hypothetical protein